ncbi:hypothetical protein [Caldiplasma sukawensis]
MRNYNKVRDFILYYTQCFDTCVIPEYELVNAVNKKFHLKYQLNRFQDRYIDKMPEFRKFKGSDGYWVYERTDMQPDPDFTSWRLKEYEEAYDDYLHNKWYHDNEEFINMVKIAQENECKDDEILLLWRKIEEIITEKTKAVQQ